MAEWIHRPVCVWIAPAANFPLTRPADTLSHPMGDPTFGISHVERERSTPLAYDLMEQFRPCVDWRVCQWVKQHPNPAEWEVTKEFRKWVTGFPLERVDYLDLSLEIQGVIEGVVRGFRKAVMENQPRHYKPWTPKNTKWAG